MELVLTLELKLLPGKETLYNAFHLRLTGIDTPMTTAMEILKPLLVSGSSETVGKVALGTVKGDIHDLGKNLVGIMLIGAGF